MRSSSSRVDAVSTEARTAESRVGAASQNVTAAASSVEELAASIGEIASQAAKSTEVAGRAVSEARRTATALDSDVYMAQFANGAAEWRIRLLKDGRIGGLALGPQY